MKKGKIRLNYPAFRLINYGSYNHWRPHSRISLFPLISVYTYKHCLSLVFPSSSIHSFPHIYPSFSSPFPFAPSSSFTRICLISCLRFFLPPQYKSLILIFPTNLSLILDFNSRFNSRSKQIQTKFLLFTATSFSHHLSFLPFLTLYLWSASFLTTQPQSFEKRD